MRIVVATDWWPPRVGGVESQVSDLATALAARNHDVRVLTTTRDPVCSAASGLQVEHVEAPMMGDVAVPDLRQVRALADFIHAHRPDVVHAHGMFSTLAVGAVLAADRLSVPSLLTVHSLLRPLPVLLGAAAVFRVFANRATLVTAVSGATAADVRRASGRPAIPIANGIELRDWSTAPRMSSCVRVVAVTRLVAKKRPIDLIQAMAFAISRAPSQARLDIVGDGVEREGLERLAVRLGIDDRITFHGECRRARVRDLVKAASLFVHAGVHEAFGLAILEARAAGVPIVAMDSGGIPELVQHGRHGLLAGDRARFCDAVATMIGDATLRARCAQEAGRGLEAYDWSCIAPQHEAAYARAIEAHYTSGRQVKSRIVAAL
jgi:glycosyltransferase involved in cell wall biosynthesis